jgi:hypothetical protein
MTNRGSAHKKQLGAVDATFREFIVEVVPNDAILRLEIKVL